MNVAASKKPRRGRSRTASQDGPDPIDIHVGARVRLRRTLMGFSQSQLGEAVGLTFQQIQKYERGANRISASMLHHLGQVLDVPVSFFFDDLPEDVKSVPSPSRDDPIGRRESLELLRHYYEIPDTVRKQIYDLVKSLGRENGNVR